MVPPPRLLCLHLSGAGCVWGIAEGVRAGTEPSVPGLAGSCTPVAVPACLKPIARGGAIVPPLLLGGLPPRDESPAPAASSEAAKQMENSGADGRRTLPHVR